MGEETRQEQAVRLFQEAYQHQMNKELDTAVELYKKSIEAYPLAEAHTFLGWTYSWMGKLEDAIAECHKAIAIDPTFGNPYNDIGAYLLRMGQIDESITWFERALHASRYESYCYPHMNLGRVYEMKRNWLRAQNHYREAIRQNKEYTPAAEALHRIRGFLN